MDGDPPALHDPPAAIRRAPPGHSATRPCPIAGQDLHISQAYGAAIVRPCRGDAAPALAWRLLPMAIAAAAVDCRHGMAVA